MIILKRKIQPVINDDLKGRSYSGGKVTISPWFISFFFLFIYSHVHTLLGNFSTLLPSHPLPLPPLSSGQVLFCPYH
jgi:hypothetical protein